jgi:hypothetical protein
MAVGSLAVIPSYFACSMGVILSQCCTILQMYSLRVDLKNSLSFHLRCEVRISCYSTEPGCESKRALTVMMCSECKVGLLALAGMQ